MVNRNINFAEISRMPLLKTVGLPLKEQQVSIEVSRFVINFRFPRKLPDFISVLNVSEPSAAIKQQSYV